MNKNNELLELIWQHNILVKYCPEDIIGKKDLKIKIEIIKKILKESEDNNG